MDFYWHYSSRELIDPAGKANFFKAIGVASQVFNTLTEVIQGPCAQNQQALAHSRLWDAVGGFLFLFSHMQDKLSKHSSQVDLLKELLNLQKDMITMMLSMLEGRFRKFEVYCATSAENRQFRTKMKFSVSQKISQRRMECVESLKSETNPEI